MLIDENTVSAENQMINSSELSFLGNPKAAKRILVVGNSITRHGPNAEIGWHGDWGMAASVPEKDYVHRLYAKLTEAGEDVYMMIRQCSYWERNFRKEDILDNYQDEKAFGADIVVFRLGENVDVAQDKPYFKEGLEKFVAHLCPETGRVVYTTCFWRNPIVDEAIEAVAKQRGETCIRGDFSVDKETMALGLFEHHGVAVHPGDKGMEKFAQVIFEMIQAR